MKYASRDGGDGIGFERVGGCGRGLGEGRIEVEIIVCRNEGFVSMRQVVGVYRLVVRVNVKMVSLVLVEEEVEGFAGRELNQSESVSSSYAEWSLYFVSANGSLFYIPSPAPTLPEPFLPFSFYVTLFEQKNGQDSLDESGFEAYSVR